MVLGLKGLKKKNDNLKITVNGSPIKEKNKSPTFPVDGSPVKGNNVFTTSYPNIINNSSSYNMKNSSIGDPFINEPKNNINAESINDVKSNVSISERNLEKNKMPNKDSTTIKKSKTPSIDKFSQSNGKNSDAQPKDNGTNKKSSIEKIIKGRSSSNNSNITPRNKKISDGFKYHGDITPLSGDAKKNYNFGMNDDRQTPISEDKLSPYTFKKLGNSPDENNIEEVSQKNIEDKISTSNKQTDHATVDHEDFTAIGTRKIIRKFTKKNLDDLLYKPPEKIADFNEFAKKEFHAESNFEMTDLDIKENTCKKKALAFTEHWAFVTIGALMTIWALIGDDIRTLSVTVHGDNIFYYITIICFLFFTVEMLICSYSDQTYFLGFFFWLDQVSTLSLLLDIGWISDIVFQTSAENANNAKNATQLARAARASRIGTRAGRIVRIIRLIRLLRVVKLYKASQTANIEEKLITKDKANEENEDKKIERNELEAEKRFIEIKLHNSNTQNEIKLHKSNTPNSLIRKDSDNRTPTPIHSQRPIRYVTPQANKLDSVGNEDFRPTTPIGSLQQMKVHKSCNLNKKDDSGNEDKVSVQFSENSNDSDGPNKNLVNLNANEIEFQNQYGDDFDPEDFQETNVGKKLSERTTKKVIIIVLSILISVPIFSGKTYLSGYEYSDSSVKNFLHALQDLSNPDAAFNALWDNYIEENKNSKNPLVYLKLAKIPYKDATEEVYKEWGNSEMLNDLRPSEQRVAQTSTETDNNAFFVIGYFDLRAEANFAAVLNIINTIFVCVVLSVSSMLFSKDANELVLSPVESMMNKVKKIASNPLLAARIQEENIVAVEQLKKMGKDKQKEGMITMNYETAILESTIVKIGGLLALGFGEAGSEIIAQNMRSSGDINPMIAGKKIMAIFGFCDIRNFTDATEVLQTDVMTFVNEIADLVHTTVDFYSGAANKNIGDAFLLVWKFSPDSVITNEDGNIELIPGDESVAFLGEMALFSFVKVQANIAKSPMLEKYKTNKGQIERLKQKEYKVRMGLGLHLGWAIEGAIGSEYKIDASYLSPNVNMAARQEAATKQFGVPLLISNSLVDILHTEIQELCRMIDKVTVMGSNQPIELYTFDVVCDALVVDHRSFYSKLQTGIVKKKLKVKMRTKKDGLHKKIQNGSTTAYKIMLRDPDIRIMRQIFIKEFFIIWDIGFKNYLAGNWSDSKIQISKCSTMIPGYDDKPSNTLLDVMGEYNFQCPSWWEGYRPLTEK